MFIKLTANEGSITKWKSSQPGGLVAFSHITGSVVKYYTFTNERIFGIVEMDYYSKKEGDSNMISLGKSTILRYKEFTERPQKNEIK